MPRLRKEVEDKIIELIEKGYKNVGISEKTGIHRKTIAKRRKEHLKRKQEQENIDTEPEKTIQQEQKDSQPIESEIHVREQLSELEKRIRKIEVAEIRENISFDTEILKRIKKLEEAQQGAKSSLLEKRITQLEESQKGSKPYLLKRRISDLETSQRLDIRIINSSIADFRKMREELVESAKRRQTDDYACQQMNKNGFCLLYYFSYDEVEKSEYLKPMGHTKREGKKFYHIKVREHPLICSACPDYEPKS